MPNQENDESWTGEGDSLEPLRIDAVATMIATKAKTSRILSLILGISLLSILYASPASAQAWTNILSSSRAINWGGAGLPATFPDGETTANPWTPPTRTQSGSTISASGVAATDLANINAALTACPAGHYVLLGAGTFLIQGIVNVAATWQNCTLRGGGPQSTTLNVSGSGVIWMGQGSGANSCLLTSGSNYAAGSTSITCNGLVGTAPAMGDIVRLEQCDTGFTGSVVSGNLTCNTGTSADNGGLFVCSYQPTCITEPTASGPNVSQVENFIVTSVSNAGGTYTIGLNTPLRLANWAFASTPALLWNNPSANGIGVAIEDMTIVTSPSLSSNITISIPNVYAGWVKGVRFTGLPPNAPIGISQSKGILILNNYCMGVPSVNGSYGGCLNSSSTSDLLVLNNILTYGTYEADGGDVGEVDGYNYIIDFFTPYVLSTIYDHHAYDAFRLEEGNEMPSVYNDDTWGTHGLYTSFRNYLPCYDAPYTTYQNNNLVSFSVGGWQRFMNAIGNAEGSPQCTGYQWASGPQTGYIYLFTGSDALTPTSFMRWGNVSTVTQSSDTPANSGIRFVSAEVPNSTNMPAGTYPNAVTWQNSTPANDNLPCSFFLPGYTSTSACPLYPTGGTGLSFWKVCTSWTTFPTSCSGTQTPAFPIAGPDKSGGSYVNGYANDNAAAIAYKYLPVDATYQTSYTITGSSWLGGLETLTVSGLPAGSVHIEGPFQTSGLNSACTTGATFGNNSEIMITGSTATTVTYTLASNPGVACTGTFKFPDVRQFDERVYQVDTTSSVIPTPTMIGFTISGGIENETAPASAMFASLFGTGRVHRKRTDATGPSPDGLVDNLGVYLQLH
jgi:hypothetical protein